MIRALHEDRAGNLWVGTYDKLNCLSAKDRQFHPFDLKGSYKASLKNNLIMDIKPASDSTLWVGTETGLVLFHTTDGTYAHFSEKSAGFSNEVIKCIYRDEGGELWLGTDFGLNIFNPATGKAHSEFHNPQIPYSLSNNVVWQVSEDTGGVIWLVTSNGLCRINKHRKHYEYVEVSHEVNGQKVGNQVKAALVGKNGTQWLGTLYGVIRIDSATGKREIFNTQSEPHRRILLNNVYALEEDAYGRIWIGTAGGINIWDEKHAKMYAITSNHTNGLITNYIARFIRGTDGTFWVSAWEGGLFKVNGDLNEISSLQFELVGDFGSEKIVSGSNSIWAIYYNELFRIDLNSYRSTKVTAFNELSSKRTLTCIYFSRKGSLWAGSHNGLIEYKPGVDSAVFHPLVTGNDITLASITEDRDGNIWGATGGYIIKFDVSDHHTQIFPLEKALPLKSFFDGCYAVAPSGELIFGGDNGYVKLAPDIRPHVYAPPVLITSLEINNRRIHPFTILDQEKLLEQDIAFTKSLNLSYAHRSISVEFSSLHYWQPDLSVFAYKLEGFDKTWNYVSGSKNFAVYSNLSPGDYTLIVKGTNNYGVWSDRTARLEIHVAPPLFLSTGFLVLYFIVALALVIIGLRMYSTRVRWKNEVKIVRMEKAHAEEIALTKQQFFTNISHELRTPISLILPPIQQTLKRENLDEESRSLIKLAEKNSYRLLRVVNQILDFRKLEHDSLELKITSFDLVSFSQELYTLFSDKAARNSIHFTFTPSVASCRIWADSDKVETILYNLLSNAFKFTPAEGSIDFSMKVNAADKDFPKGSVEISVSDTGIGISAEDQPKIFDRFYQTTQARKIEGGSGIGLTLASEYATLHHGEIKVESEEGHGSRFSLYLPLGNLHFPVDATQEEVPLTLVATKTTGARTDRTPYQYDVESDKPLILVVEDNADMVDFLVINLKNKYHLILSENGEDALLKTHHFSPEIIISDIMMPVMDGLTLCKKVKEDPRTSHIGIILLTAKNLTAQKIEGIRMGADVYLTKPFEVELLEASIDHLLKRKQELSNYFKSEIITEPNLSSKGENIDDKFIRKVANVIEVNIANPNFSVEMLSDEIGMSSTHLYRKLKSLTHFSPKDIIRKYRIKKASLLLKNKEGNISEIMYEVGFSNLSYFAKCFKSEFGISPKEYQQRESKNTVDLGEDFSPHPPSNTSE
jgi:signal transduction histidine kinase/DNA-binding response OmpR family regulator/ligand-binding sensor domain-containing protein